MLFFRQRALSWRRRQTVQVLWSLLLLTILAGCSFPFGTSNGATPTPTAGAASRCTTHSDVPQTLTFSYSSEKQAWITDVVAAFNRDGQRACDGPITIKAVPGGSGSTMQQILSGASQPDIWSPAGGVWLTLLNTSWHDKHGQDLLETGANDTPSLVTSPVVIAMWKPQAEALGWPTKALGWADIAQLSVDPRGWSAYGHPEFGDFKFGHTHPGYSNSGLDAVIAMNYAASGKVRGLTSADVQTPAVKEFVANVESSVIHYGDSTGFFADQMFNRGPSYLSAAVMYESSVIEANDGQSYPKLAFPVVAIYPKEGTFYSDHPFAVLQGPWVTPAHKAAAQVFRDYLLAPAQQAKALHYGFRPASGALNLSAPIDSAHGVDPKQPATLLQVPPAPVVQAIEAAWSEQRRKVDVALVLDRSGSMNDQINGTSKIAGARQGLSDFVNLLGDADQLGLITFSDQASVLSPVTPLGPKRAAVLKQISGITAAGSTHLYDTIADEVKALKALPSKHIKAVVVLTDGNDTGSTLTLDQLVSQIQSTGTNAGNSIKVFTIAYGGDADVSALQRIATATGGQEYAGTPQNIQDVYNQISQFF